MAGVGGDDVDVPLAGKSAQQAGTVRMQIRGKDLRVRISCRQQSRLAARGGTAIQDSFSPAHQYRHELRRFVLNEDTPLPKCPDLGHIAGGYTARAGEQQARRESNALAGKFLICLIVLNVNRLNVNRLDVNRGDGHGLVMEADLDRRRKAIAFDPSCHHPLGMG